MIVLDGRSSKRAYRKLKDLVPQHSNIHDPFIGLENHAVSCRGAALIAFALNSGFTILKHEWSSARLLVGEDERHFFALCNDSILHTTARKGPSLVLARNYFATRDRLGCLGNSISYAFSNITQPGVSIEVETIDDEGDLVFSRVEALDPQLFLAQHTDGKTMDELKELVEGMTR